MVRRALFWSFLGQISALLINFTGSLVVARLLGPQQLGIYAVAVATMSLIQVFATFSVALYLVREHELTTATLSSAFTLNFLISVLTSVALYIVSFGASSFLHETAVKPVLQLLAVTPLITALSFLPTAMLQRRMLFKGSSLIGIGAALAANATTISCAAVGYGAVSFAYGSIAAAVLSSVLFMAIAPEHLAWRPSLTGWKPMLSFGFRIMSIGGVATGTGRIADIVLGHLLGLSALGLYSRAANINGLLFQNVYGVITRVIFSQLSEVQRAGADVSVIYLRGLRLVIAVMGPALLGLAVLSRPAIRILYGARWEEAALPLSLLLLGQFIALSFAMNWELFVVRDRLKTQTRLEVTRSLLTLIAQVVGSFFSIAAAAASGVFSNAVAAVIYGRFMPSLANTDGARLRRIYLEGVTLSTLTAAPALILMIGTGWNADVSPLLLAGVVTLGAIIWLGVIFRTEHPAAQEMAAALRSLLARRHDS